jgi:hypothetical protein
MLTPSSKATYDETIFSFKSILFIIPKLLSKSYQKKHS